MLEPARPNAVRSLTLLGLGAAVGLLIAGFGLFQAKGTATRILPPENVAMVNGRPIYTSDLIAQVEAAYGAPFAQATRAQKLKSLNDMIREELYVQRGLELDVPSNDPDTRNALVAAVEQQVVASVNSEVPTDAQLRAFFDAHRDRYSEEGTMTVIDLVAPPGAGGLLAARQAKSAIDAKSATDAAVAGGRFGLKDSRKTNGKEFYFAAQLHLGAALFKAARVLKSGQVSEPIAQADGAHLLVMVQNTPPLSLSFEEARAKLFSDYKSAEEARRQQADERYLRGKADILIDAGYRDGGH